MVVAVDERTGKVLSGPEITTRGFVYVRESEELLEETRKAVCNWLSRSDNLLKDPEQAKRNLRNSLRSFIYEKLQRRPMIVPIILEVPGTDGGKRSG